MTPLRLERAYRTFVRCRHVVVCATSETQLFESVCATLVKELGFRLAWVGLIEPGAPEVRPVAQNGYAAGYLESIAITWSDDEHGAGPTGRAIRERRSCVCQDIAHAPEFVPWRSDALARGYASSAAIPLLDGSRCFGALNLYAAEPDAFDDDEIALLEEMAVDLALGIVRLRMRNQIDELIAQMERAAHAETAGIVAAALAHDMNNQLQVISLAIEAARIASGTARGEHALGLAAAAADTATTMMRQLLSIARRALQEADGVEVDKLVLGLEPLLTRLAPPATLELHLGATDARASICTVDLERIVINLVVNAAHASPSGGVIRVATERRHVGPEGAITRSGRVEPGYYLVVSVADDGSGIPAEVLPRIFDPFFSTKGEVGSGLGLASVLHLARGAGGAVDVESSPGKGARFLVFIATAA